MAQDILWFKFLSPEDVEDFFVFDLFAEAPTDGRITEFTDYLYLVTTLKEPQCFHHTYGQIQGLK